MKKPTSRQLQRMSRTERELDAALRRANKALKRDLIARTGRSTLPCSHCEGSGNDPLNGFGHPDEPEKCLKCEGKGRQHHRYPVVLSEIRFGSDRQVLRQDKTGSWVAIRPVACEKTYLGILIGDMATSTSCLLNRQGVLDVTIGMMNPAIYVPELKRVVFGYESWWGIISSPEHLKKITDADIENIWYVKALKELGGSDAAA